MESKESKQLHVGTNLKFNLAYTSSKPVRMQEGMRASSTTPREESETTILPRSWSIFFWGCSFLIITTFCLRLSVVNNGSSGIYEVRKSVRSFSNAKDEYRPSAEAHHSTNEKWPHWSDVTKKDEIVNFYLSNNGTIFTFVIEIRKPCHEYNFTEFFPNSSSVGYMQNFFHHHLVGPDEIYVQIEGNSMQTMLARQENRSECGTYFVNFKIPTNFLYRVKVFRVRKDYYAVREAESLFPNIDYELLLDEKVALPLRRSIDICGSYPGHDKVNGYWIAVSDFSNPYFDQPIYQNFQERGYPIKTYMNISTAHVDTVDLFNVGEKKSCAEDVDLFEWNTKLCSTAVDSDEKESNYSATGLLSTSAINHNTSILFVGDEIMQDLKDFFAKMVYDCENYKEKRSSVVCPQIVIEYMSTTSCQAHIADRISRFDFAVINCGHHPALDQFTFQMYDRQVARLFAAINYVLHGKISSSEKSTAVIWLESTAAPLRITHENYWLTNPRISIFNSIAASIVQSYNISIVPSFTSTLTFFDKLCLKGISNEYPIGVMSVQLQTLLREMVRLQKKQ